MQNGVPHMLSSVKTQGHIVKIDGGVPNYGVCGNKEQYDVS